MLKQRNVLTPNHSVTLDIEGITVTVAKGTSVAAAALLAGLSSTRNTPVNGAPRAPYCFMGVCFECLMDIDGQANQRACQIIACEGMVVRIQDGRREVDT